MFASSKAAGRLIIVSNRLPVTVTEKDSTLSLSRSTGGLATALSAVFKQSDALWVGWSGFHRRLSRLELKNLAFPTGLVPVNLTTEQVKRYRDRAFNETLYPVFLHHYPLNPCEEKDWQTLIQVMQRFAKIIKRVAKPGDVIWVHDTQLALLPHFLREAGVTNRIGFFFHIPFPHITYLKQLPIASLLLDSLNQTDLLGFQVRQDVQHFEEGFRVMHPGKLISPTLRAFPIGVDFDEYHAAVTLPGVRAQITEAAKVAAGKKVIFSMSRLDFTKGIVDQLLAVESFLDKQAPEERKKFIYTLVVAPSREDVLQNQHYKHEIEHTVNRINRRLAAEDWQPVHYIYQALGFEEVNAWYQLADVLLVTPRLDGMNLVAKEYIAARHNDDGMLVLSKTIGSALQLNQSILVNAYDVANITAGLERAFAMTPAERHERWAALRANVKQEDIFWWTKNFIDALERLNQPTVSKSRPFNLIGPQWAHP
jgi:trehalose 6-phosphate synthase/phosphatase